MATIKEYRNLTTSETAPAHRIGEDDADRPIYQRIEGWEPVVEGGTYLSDGDGNWIPADHDYAAKWDATQGMYIVRELSIWSEDGDNWHDDFGGQPDSEAFHAATITFDGGPRNGESIR